jgi:hypothetical protein
LPPDWGYEVLLIVLGNDHDLEPTIILIWASDPIRVENLHPSGSLACARHDIE